MILLSVLLAASLFAAAIYTNIITSSAEPTDSDEIEKVGFCFLGERFALDFPMCNVEGYTQSGMDRERVDFFGIYRMITPEDPTIIQLCSKVDSLTAHMDRNTKAEYLRYFVWTEIDYATDAENHGKDDYWQFPLETLYSCKGDCEDKAFLLATIYTIEGYDVRMVFNDDHMACAVHLEGFDGKELTTMFGNGPYYLSDPSNGSDLGTNTMEGFIVGTDTLPWTIGTLSLFSVLSVVLVYTIISVIRLKD